MSVPGALSERAARILVADDDAGVRESVGRVLRAAGYEPLLAADGAQALTQWQTGQVDLLLLDLNLPAMSGWEVFERIAGESPSMPIIIMTGLANQQSTALAAGVGILMEKPLDVQSLLGCIEELLAEPAATRMRRPRGRGGAFKHFPPGISSALANAKDAA